jgi:aryl-alcohol dehydrogenase-like predicted oxidoreductase
MEYRQLGRSGLSISTIGFGCMSLESDDRENERLVHRAIDAGINFFDTADIYDKGRNEETLGRVLKGRRAEIILATKVGNQWRPDGSGLDWNPSRRHILSSIDDSLRRLQTDYIDLYQLHGGTIGDPIDDAIAAFEWLREKGKIRCYGISSIRPNVIREYARRSSIASVMMQYSLLDRRPEEEAIDLLSNLGIGILARGSLAQGLLIDKPGRDYLEHPALEVGSLAQLVRNVSNERRTPAQTALRFVLQKRGITSAVCGIRTPLQLEELLASPDSPPLSPSEIATLETFAGRGFYHDHR